jgi:hypothetical protein
MCAGTPVMRVGEVEFFSIRASRVLNPGELVGVVIDRKEGQPSRALPDMVVDQTFESHIINQIFTIISRKEYD